MNTDALISLTMQGMLLCLYVTLPVIIVSAVSGLLVSFLQAITSLQDQTISHSVKLIAVCATVAMTAAWGGASILRFAQQLVTVAIPS
ncbi:aldolase [Robbsia andropogonis]|uniref:Aldolase n=1 Tax=Robbsia andropogonis TaxID=28092 RepID=A0A0F5JYP1_9BURK|nr:type III secretion system export apparatus subunit SctS [Robbsia andropogonis]KKB62724.1 aldolase [Robbsia andropogonis]MCP1119714.1 type III secretion system export apparatus subunit SctS [Robbsia andropogonis]MCP1129697.1 type III secretion system export apparatus subunit SctS [Robbsia andropogonis]